MRCTIKSQFRIFNINMRLHYNAGKKHNPNNPLKNYQTKQNINNVPDCKKSAIRCQPPQVHAGIPTNPANNMQRMLLEVCSITHTPR